MQHTFSNAIALDDQERILRSALLERWLRSGEKDFLVSGIHYESADFVTRKGERTLLFLKLKATATDRDGRAVPGIVMLRGDVVAVLVVLYCRDKRYVLLVDQPRFAIGVRHSLEIVAGMLDWSADWRVVALAELEEEAGISVDDTELHALGKPIAVSCGLLDEMLQLAFVEREVDLETTRIRYPKHSMNSYHRLPKFLNPPIKRTPLLVDEFTRFYNSNGPMPHSF